MSGFEYKVVPAPMRGLKAKGVKGTPARFANALETVMNDLGAEGWEYQRTDTLPVEERQGLTGKTTSFQNMLVFRRALSDEAEETVAALIEDQSDTIDETQTPPQDDAVEADDPVDDIAASTEAEAEDVAEDAAPQKDALALAAQDRVSDTLKAPFAFPWNKRAPANTDRDSDRRDTNLPAE